MTTDDLISMHKACTDVLDNMAMFTGQPEEWDITAHAAAIHQSVVSLATVQRDLIKSALGS